MNDNQERRSSKPLSRRSILIPREPMKRCPIGEEKRLSGAMFKISDEYGTKDEIAMFQESFEGFNKRLNTRSITQKASHTRLAIQIFIRETHKQHLRTS